MSLFKRAYVRGINDTLIHHGYVRYPTKLAADEVADAVADQMVPEPAAGGDAVSPDTAAEVAATLIDSANTLMEEAGGGAEMAPGPEEAALKTSAARDLGTRAGEQAYAVMVKAAEETKLAVGSTVEGGDKGNKMTDTPAAETQMEAKNRPEMAHVMGVDGVGKTEHDAGRGTGVVGNEDTSADTPAPHETPGNEGNTVIQQSKMGSALREIIQKVAMGSTIQGGDKGNKMTEAPAAETQMEATNRPEGYAEQMLAQTDLPVTPAATVGTEQAHEKRPGESPSGTVPGDSGNSVVEHSEEAKTGAFLELFKKTAEEVAKHLPSNMDEGKKIAHVRQMMGLTDAERTEYIGLLHKEAGATDDQAVEAAKTAACSMREHRSRYKGNEGRKDRRRANQKTAAELPAALKEKAEEMKDKAEDKKEDKSEAKSNGNGEKKEEKKEEENPFEAMKEGSDLLSRIRRVSQSAQL